ncbi:MAG: diguanylate cyclase [Butyrivibrio sp.]|nr:GGDEF domain-containing protein [Butyrivibrio sp.]MBE5824974.1 diguanylate cyclase [Butyrivibrio sp.]MBR1642267.1 GGDEF domain-containing protein [Butyrivibrio sp.]
MKPEFYNTSKRANVYNSIFIYKIISLIVAVVLAVTLAVLFIRDKALYKEFTDSHPTAFFIVVAIFLAVYILSIVIDFFILHHTVSIRRRLNNLAFLDHLTGLPNRYSCDLLIESFNDEEHLPDTGFFLMQISNLGNINVNEGHKNGNYLISEFSSILEDVAEAYGYVGRNGGNEFIVLLEDCDHDKADRFLSELSKRIRGYNDLNVGAPLEVRYSKVLNKEANKEKISEIISLGYQKIREMPLALS